MSCIRDIVASLQGAGLQATSQDGRFRQGSIIDLLNYPYPLQIYAWQISDNGQATGNERPADERRIQASRTSKIFPDEIGETVVLGWSEDFSPEPMIVAFNPYGVASRVNFKIERKLAAGGQNVRVSDSQQFRQNLLDEASVQGISIGTNQHGDVVVVMRPENLLHYLQVLKPVHHIRREVDWHFNGAPRAMRDLIEEAEIEVFGALIPTSDFFPGVFDPGTIEDGRERIAREMVIRRGQTGFRNQLLAVYGCCAMSGCTLYEVLEAAHIVPYLGPGTNHVLNGLLLRSDLHVLFDLGLLAFDETSFTILVSSQLNGTEYEGLRRRSFVSQFAFRPSLAALAHHRQIFVN